MLPEAWQSTKIDGQNHEWKAKGKMLAMLFPNLLILNLINMLDEVHMMPVLEPLSISYPVELFRANKTVNTK